MTSTRRSFLALGPLAVATPALLQDSAENPAKAQVAPIQVLLLRHAETEGDTKNVKDPRLSKQGQERADGLAKLLSQAGVTHLFASEYLRTQDTLRPLAEAAKLEIQMISARQPKDQVAAIQALPPGSVAVLAGHSNTTPALVEALGGRFERRDGKDSGTPMIRHEVHSRVFLLQLSAGLPATTLELSN